MPDEKDDIQLTSDALDYIWPEILKASQEGNVSPWHMIGALLTSQIRLLEHGDDELAFNCYSQVLNTLVSYGADRWGDRIKEEGTMH